MPSCSASLMKRSTSRSPEKSKWPGAGSWKFQGTYVYSKRSAESEIPRVVCNAVQCSAVSKLDQRMRSSYCMPHHECQILVLCSYRHSWHCAARAGKHGNAPEWCCSPGCAHASACPPSTPQVCESNEFCMSVLITLTPHGLTCTLALARWSSQTCSMQHKL